LIFESLFDNFGMPVEDAEMGGTATEEWITMSQQWVFELERMQCCGDRVNSTDVRCLAMS
jgi:hypothetical protein